MQGGVGATAAERCGKRLREEATCSVCLDYFADPVALDCGHNFCRACITEICAKTPADAACPQCRERVQTSSLRPNRHLASVVEAVKMLSDLPRPEAGGHKACDRHQEPLKLFCQDDEAPICVVCDRSKEHRAHRVVPVDEAAQEYQDKITYSVEILRKERGNVLQFQARNEKESQDLLNVGDILGRCKKESFENPMAFPVDLKWRVHDFCDTNPCLEALMKQFQDSLASGLQLQEANVTGSRHGSSQTRPV